MTADHASRDEIERLLAEHAIERVLHAYCRGIDRMDRELVSSCYHPDAVDTHGSFEGGVDEFLAWVWRLLDRYEHTMHMLTNILVDIDENDSDVAVCESYGIAFHSSANPDPKLNLITGFRFADRFERRPEPGGARGRWRIARRVATTEWVRADRPEARWPIPATMLRGRRDRGDVIYRIRDM